MWRKQALISFAVTAKLVCVFVFAYAKSRFSHDEAHLMLPEYIVEPVLSFHSYSKGHNSNIIQARAMILSCLSASLIKI